jgi:hypothetical protein
MYTIIREPQFHRKWLPQCWLCHLDDGFITLDLCAITVVHLAEELVQFFLDGTAASPNIPSLVSPS